jgi:hypothetical protein
MKRRDVWHCHAVWMATRLLFLDNDSQQRERRIDRAGHVAWRFFCCSFTARQTIRPIIVPAMFAATSHEPCFQ